MKKYSLYAIGEIFLVVIGILIALAINNWNENRKDQIKEKQILSDLHIEFQQNKKIIQELIENQNASIGACHSLMELMSQKNPSIEDQNLDSLLYWSIEHFPFVPSNSTFTEILQTGKISLISDPILKNKLYKWSRELDNNKDGYGSFINWINEGVIPFYSKNVAIKNIDKYSPMAWKQESKFENGYVEILNNREFENLIDNNLYHRILLRNLAANVEKIIDEIIQKTK